MSKKKEAPVPTSRVGRFGRMVKIAGGIAGGMVAEGGRRIRDGEKLNAKDMLLTPGNAQRLTKELSKMRGAAMKMGQMLSMEGGDILPKELSDILARLRQDAMWMPAAQLDKAMETAYGEDWQDIFYAFNFTPVAAASIGQVHKAISPEGDEVALKIQYPGVAKSIDSDVDNISTLLRMSGQLPDSIDIKPILKEAKLQLKDEADYLLEAKYLATFHKQLENDDRFLVPEVFTELSRENVLVMSYIEADPIEVIAELPQADRDRIMTDMLDLMMQEFFDWRIMQTDPNFANYRYKKDTGEIVLLDFGATRKFSATFVNDYKRLVKAALKGDTPRFHKAAQKLGYLPGNASQDYLDFVEEIFNIILEGVLQPGPYDFGATTIPAQMMEYVDQIQDYKEFWSAPPTDAIFFHRKVGGMFMLASRMNARVDVHKLLHQWL